MALSLIVFDCDGVILESVDAKTKAFAQVAEPLGAEARDRLVLYHTLHGGVSRREKFAWLYREVFHREITHEEMEDSLMRPGSFILNIARGGLIDEKALLGLLTAGHLAGAALDCFAKEPYDGPLKEMDNVILTPHVGSYAKEARIIMETDTIRNLLAVLFPGA